MERLWTVRDVMAVLPYGKTKVTAIVNSLPHIGEDGDKLLIEPRYIRKWINRNTHCGAEKSTPPPAARKPRQSRVEGLTADGLIPYRKRGA